MSAPRLRFPHPLILLVLCVLVAAILTWVLPAGEYDRREDKVAQREVVVAGTYHAVPASPVGPFDALVAIPKGMADASSIIFYVFLVGGAFAVVERTGALAQLVNWLAQRLAGRGLWVIPIVGFAFAWGGILIQMQEELIAFVPVLLLLVRRLGFNALIAVAISLGAAAVGASFSPINPFQVGIAQKVAGLDLLSGWELRSVALLAAWLIWIAGTMRFARRSRVPPEAAVVGVAPAAGGRQTAILGIVLLAFVVFVVGVTKYGWDFEQLSALFFLMGVAAGLIGRLGLAGTADGYVEGFRSMAYAALLIGFARGIYVVLDEGHVVDTIVHGLFAPGGGAAHDARRARHDGGPGAGAPPRAQHQRPGGADDAAARAAVRPHRAVPPGDGAGLPVRRGALRAADADQRRADGHARRERGALRGLAAVRGAGGGRARGARGRHHRRRGGDGLAVSGQRRRP